jgi:hypothetical protein
MMMAEKRPAESGQSKEDTFAVCPSCSRISNNLSSCDTCGAPLSADNTAECYTSEPKRQRTDNGPSTPTNLTNGRVTRSSPRINPVSTSETNGTSRSTPSTMNQAQPVPQALYMNTSNMTNNGPSPVSQPPGISSSVRPQALYVNVNNQVLPTVMQQLSSSGQVVTQGNSLTASAGAPVLQTQVVQSGASRPMMNSGGLVSSAGNSQYGVFPGSIMTGQVSMGGSVMTRPPPLGGTTRPPPYPSMPAASTPPNFNPPQQQQAANVKLSLPVSQIRVGLKRFSPATGVQFKEDGVMFTLKEYHQAPLMVNARAITKCKANMTPPFCAFFFYLEGSCIKQIRGIFNMKEWEFNDKSAVDKVRCISIFPSVIGARQSQLIQDSFMSMEVKFRRTERILQMIDMDTVIDILYGTNVGNLNEYAAQAEASRASESTVATNNVAGGARYGTNYQQPAQRPTASQILRTAAQASIGGSPQQGQAVRPISSTPAQMVARPNANTPTLVIPNDASRWNAMKKTLMVGGVYQVQMGDGQRKYCVWNGSNLQPCLVQDTEVQLRCKHVRIGSLRANVSGPVRVQNDNNVRGISFVLEVPSSSTPVPTATQKIDIFLPYGELNDVQLSTERIHAIFVYPNQTNVQRLRTRLHMTSYQKDPYYNPSSKDERHKHLVLFMEDINRDQKEALLKMKTPPTNKNFFHHIDVMRALQIISAINDNSKVQSKMDDYFGANANNIQDPIDKIVKEFQTSTTRAGTKPSALDDDDDDVIMTEEEIGTKCPYTQKEMDEPVRNLHCNHNYEKRAIYEFIQRKRMKSVDPKCPYAGCGNLVPLRMDDLIFNTELLTFIKNKKQKTS